MKRLAPLLCLILLAWGCTETKAPRPVSPDEIEAEKSMAPVPTFSAPVDERLMSREKKGAPAAGKRGHRAPSASGLRAAYANDNRQFNLYLDFLKTYKEVPHIPADVSERITLTVLDKEGLTLPDCDVAISLKGKVVERGKTTADGMFRTFPALYAGKAQTLEATLRYNSLSKKIALDRSGRREVTVTLDTRRALPDAVPLDLLFILDTTGSMGEEIDQLKTSIDLINLNLSQLSVRPLIRYGMVLYRDTGDAYVTKTVPFTSRLEDFSKELAGIRAEGGGDTPEDLESALKKGIDELNWNDEGVKLAFAITDAPPHLDYDHAFTYMDAARTAREKGIKIFSVGTGGLSLDGEYVLRQLSQLTGGAYIFLTYGERGESEGGAPGSVSHHTGANFTSDKLEAVIINIARNELNHLVTQPDETHGEYFEGVAGSTKPEEVTEELFTKAVAQLADYAAMSLSDKPATAILPLASELSKADSAYLTSALLIAATRHPLFTVVERDNTSAIVDEITLGLSGYVDEKTAAEAGRLTGAGLLMAGRVVKSGSRADVIVRLIRVETGEILSATRILMEGTLLPSAWD
ncbi:VWA domain-containing protein [Desulfoluna spongiiphila]|uniref:VWA domain-containing protein n=1 Tax=Desulfoluna spongiiphila TaxID=419481 RepID=UPI001258317D|nr:VWA domain-containing protein [Desulfoluna spongiiphila]VVS92495.1 curli production assembly/transport component csgg [Desulfoluna spongiiphila]